MNEGRIPVAVVGGGQAGLAVAYFLRRAGIEHVVLDDQPAPGGAWRHTWPSLRLFPRTISRRCRAGGCRRSSRARPH